MTKKQFEKLMEKLDRIEQEIKRPDNPYKFVPMPPQPAQPWDGLPPNWGLPKITD